MRIHGPCSQNISGIDNVVARFLTGECELSYWTIWVGLDISKSGAGRWFHSHLLSGSPYSLIIGSLIEIIIVNKRSVDMTGPVVSGFE